MLEVVAILAQAIPPSHQLASLWPIMDFTALLDSYEAADISSPVMNTDSELVGLSVACG